MDRKQTFLVCVIISITVSIWLVISMHGKLQAYLAFNLFKNDELSYGNIKDIDKHNLSSISFCNDPELYYLLPDSETSGVAISREITIFRTRGGYCKLNTPQRASVFRNLCFTVDQYFESSLSPVRAFFTSYDSLIAGRRHLFPIHHGGAQSTTHDAPVNYWQVTGHKSSARKERDQMFWPSVLAFSPFLVKHYSFEEMHYRVLPQLHKSLELLKEIEAYYTQSKKGAPPVTLVVPTANATESSLSQTRAYLGYDNMFTYEHLTANGPFCFKWAIFGADPIHDNVLDNKNEKHFTPQLKGTTRSV